MKVMDTVPSENETFHAGASFRVAGLDLDMDDIARGLGHNPSYTHRRGEPNRILGKPRPRDMWRLDSPLGKGQDLELHLNWLAERLLPRKQYISSLRGKAEVDIYCFKTCYTEQASLTLSPHALRIFTELSLELCVSLIFLPDEPDEMAASTFSQAAQP
jgi:Domain of unknown function (DUF4279)